MDGKIKSLDKASFLAIYFCLVLTSCVESRVSLIKMYSQVNSNRRIAKLNFISTLNMKRKCTAFYNVFLLRFIHFLV